MSEVIKPPLGLQPKKLWRWSRAMEIVKALKRYNSADKVPPLEWIEELEEYLNDN